MKSFADIIDRWPSLGDFARDLGISYVNAQQMRFRDSIASDHWSKVEEMARKRGFSGVTVKVMADLKASQKTSGKPRPNKIADQPAA